MVDSGIHYDQVTNLFEILLGENLHVGYFDNQRISLRQASEALTKKMAEIGGVKEGAKVIDVGCGVGGPARYLTSQYRAEVTGISNSQECISKASRIERPHVNYLCMNALELVDSNLRNFDLAWLLESSHLMDDKYRLFLGLNSVLKEKGKFVLCDFFLNNEGFAKDRRNILKMRKIYKVFGRLDLTLPTVYQMKAEEVGFANVNLIDITQKTLPTLDSWIQEAENQEDGLIGKKDFIEGVQFLQELYQNEIVCYQIISGEKP